MSRQDDKSFLAEKAYDEASGLDIRVRLQDVYGTAPVPWFDWLFQHLRLAPGSRVLDVGCGPGYLWHNNRHRLPPGLRLALTDLSEGMVAASRRRLQGIERPLVYVVADGERLPFRPSQFDAVIALGLVDHLPDKKAFLKRVESLLAPGGRFFTSAAGLQHLKEFAELLGPFSTEETVGGEPRSFGLHNGKELLLPYFSDVQLFLYEDLLAIDSSDAIVDYVLSEPQVAEKMTGRRRAAFVQAVERQLAKDGLFRVTRQKALFVGSR